MKIKSKQNKEKIKSDTHTHLFGGSKDKQPPWTNFKPFQDTYLSYDSTG